MIMKYLIFIFAVLYIHPVHAGNTAYDAERSAGDFFGNLLRGNELREEAFQREKSRQLQQRYHEEQIENARLQRQLLERELRQQNYAEYERERQAAISKIRELDQYWLENDPDYEGKRAVLFARVDAIGKEFPPQHWPTIIILIHQSLTDYPVAKAATDSQ
jgi:hypothetical protein